MDGRGTLRGTFPNPPHGFAQLARHPTLAQATASHLVVEPTGGYELALAHGARQQGWQVSVPNPKQVRDCAKGRGHRATTDGQDALLLARFGAETDPPGSRCQRRWLSWTACTGARTPSSSGCARNATAATPWPSALVSTRPSRRALLVIF